MIFLFVHKLLRLDELTEKLIESVGSHFITVWLVTSMAFVIFLSNFEKKDNCTKQKSQ